MKKISTLILVLFVSLLVLNSTVYAANTENISTDSNSNLEEDFMYMIENHIENSIVYPANSFSFDSIVNSVMNSSSTWVYNTGEKITWVICSLNKHTGIQVHLFYGENTESYNQFLSTIDNAIDFAQIGSFLQDSLLEGPRNKFEDDSSKIAYNAILSSSVDANYAELKVQTLPAYWDIFHTNDGLIALNVAVGKYIIEAGDTLSIVAEKNNTTVERLLEFNQHIQNKNLIYANDYLVVL